MPKDQDQIPTDELFAPGTKIDHYIIKEPLGSGAVGVVYLAYDSTLDRNVALKFLSRNLCSDKRQQKRFQQEARATAQLNHPGIVTIHEVEEHRNQPFISMEYIEGGSIDEYVKSRQLPIEAILELAIQISDGLTEAHSRGIIHRDLKPSNILVNNQGRVKIVDFGLAALLKQRTERDKGLIVGTAHYMSPEQVRGSEVDERSDLFSLGIVLYQIFTGKIPFAGKDLRQTFQMIQETEPLPMVEYSAFVPLELERIVSRLLRKDREQRFRSASDLSADLRYTLEAAVSGRLRYAGRKQEYARSTAVLPFANLGADREQDYFCDGMAEEIINALTRAKGLNVAARTSTLAFKGSNEDIREIGRKLHVETLLEGSVRRSGDRLRVSVQLIDVASGYHLWSERYDEEMKDIFTIQDTIARNVVHALQLILSKDEKQALTRTSTTDIQAYDYYLRGLHFYHQGLRKSYQFAREMFMKATEVDPDYALAHAGLADCCAMLVHLYGESGEIHLSEGDRASLRAIELDPKLAYAHTARGLILWLLNRFDEAKSEFETAMMLDPGQAQAPYVHGRACFQRGEFDQAARLFEESCRRQETYEARYFAAQTYTAMGKTESANTAYRLALRATEKHVELNPDDARAFTIGAVALIRLGERKAGLEWVEHAVSTAPNDAGIQYNAACLFALEGDKDRAIECLENAVSAGFAHKEWVTKDPDLDSLRDDPRFKSLKWRE